MLKSRLLTIPMKRLLSLKSKLVSLPTVQILNIVLIIGVAIGVRENVNLDLEISKQQKVLEILKNRKPHVSDNQYQEEFNSLIRYKNIIIDQYVSEYSSFGPKSDSILAEYTMSLKGRYGNFINYLKYIDKLKLIKTIHSLDMKNEADYIRMNLNLDVVYEKD